MCSFLMERIFQSTPNGVLIARTEWLLSVQMRYFITTSAVQTYGGLQGLVVVWLS